MKILLVALFVVALVMQVWGAVLLMGAGKVTATESPSVAGAFTLSQDDKRGRRGTLLVVLGLIVATVASLLSLWL